MNKKSECEQAIRSLACEWFDELPDAARRRGAFGQIATRLAQLTDADLEWARSILDAALAPRRADQQTILAAPQTRKGAISSRRANRRKSGQ